MGQYKYNAIQDATGVTNITLNSSGQPTIGGLTSLVTTNSTNTANLAADTTTRVLLLTFNGAVTVTLPTPNAANTNRQITVKRSQNLGVVTISSPTGTIDGSASNAFIQATYDTLSFVCDGSNWFIIDRNLMYQNNPKAYLINTAYTNGTPTVSAGGNVSSVGTVHRGIWIPRQLANGTWWAILNFTSTGATVSSATTHQLTFSGVTFKNTASFEQSVIGSHINVSVTFSYCVALVNSGTIQWGTVGANSATVFSVYADVELESKPTWAD